MTVSVVREPDDERLAQAASTTDGDLHAESRCTAGQMRGVVLETGAAGPPREIRVAEAQRLFDETVALLAGLARRSRPTPAAGARRCSARRSR